MRCLLGLRCLWCSAWCSTLCGAFLPGPAVLGSFPCRRLPLGVSAFSDTVCLAYCCAGDFGWAATLPLCSQCFSWAGWLAGVRWVLHPVSGSSHGGCDCSLGDSVGVPYGSHCLSGFVTCSVISSCSSCPLWMLCSVHCLVYLALRWVRFWPAVSMAPVRCGVGSLGCPSWLVPLLRSLLVLHLFLRWGGLVTGLWPLLLLLCVGLLWGLCCAVLSPWALARPTLSGLRLWIPMVSWSKLLVPLNIQPVVVVRGLDGGSIRDTCAGSSPVFGRVLFGVGRSPPRSTHVRRMVRPGEVAPHQSSRNEGPLSGSSGISRRCHWPSRVGDVRQLDGRGVRQQTRGHGFPGSVFVDQPTSEMDGEFRRPSRCEISTR